MIILQLICLNDQIYDSHPLGAYQVEVENGQVSALTPFDHDPDPSPIGLGMPQALSDSVRIRQPMVRKAWLEKGRDQTGATPTKGRGKGPFVAVSWERAWDLAADELERVRTTFGNQAIYAGSYRWGKCPDASIIPAAISIVS